jgi:hypothetical protein
MVGETPEELAAEFRFSSNTNPRVKKPVFHASLSLPKGEKLRDTAWNDIADDYMLGMQFTANSYAVIRHTDSEHDHIHIAASRVRLDERSSCVKDSWDRPRSEKIIRSLEKKYNLSITASSTSKDRRSPTTGECRLLKRTGERSVKAQLSDTIDDLSTQSSTMPGLIERLLDRGIDVRVKPTPTGELGISYLYQGIALSGSHLGKAYTFHGLQKHRGISYSPERDDDAIFSECQPTPIPLTSSETAEGDDSSDYSVSGSPASTTKPTNPDDTEDASSSRIVTISPVITQPELLQDSPIPQDLAPLGLGVVEAEPEEITFQSSTTSDNKEKQSQNGSKQAEAEEWARLLHLQQIKSRRLNAYSRETESESDSLAMEAHAESDSLAQWFTRHPSSTEHQSNEPQQLTPKDAEPLGTESPDSLWSLQLQTDNQQHNSLAPQKTLDKQLNDTQPTQDWEL